MNQITPVRLHLELIDDYLSGYRRRMLKRYGESTSGNSLTRDILIPSDMPLHNLHYAIQRLFGWQNSHLRSFYLPENIYRKLTGGTVKGWSDLVGILFQPLSEAEHDLFWDDDYQKGSIKTWLKRKYTGPYYYGGTMEHPEVARKDVNEFLEAFKALEVRESFSDYMARAKIDENAEIKILRVAPIIDLTLEEMHASIIIEQGTESLLERLEINKLVATLDEDINSEDLFPVTRELIYNYDFGDNWIIKITKHENCDDLLAANKISLDELVVAEDIVIDEHKPVCIHKEGLSVLDDVGGLGGFADFLGIIYESEDRQEASILRGWARSLGWNATKVASKKMI